MFLKHGYVFRDKVMNKDEEFMLDTNFLENENKTSENENIMNTLKLEWKSLEDDEKFCKHYFKNCP